MDFAQRLAEVAETVEAALDALLAPDAARRRDRAAGAGARGDALWRARRRQKAASVPHHRDRAGARRRGDGGAAGGRGDRMRALLFAGPRRPAGDGRRRSRRGRPTAHKAFDEATAILAGDGLLTLAFDILADPATHADAEVRVALCLGLARAAGLGGMVGGQMLDIEAETSATPLDDAAIRRLQAMKTGAILRFAVEAGAIVAGADGRRRKALVRYGEALGSAFQVADDILDAEATSEQLGKRAGKDAERNKGTFVSSTASTAPRACATASSQAIAALAAAGLGGGRHFARGGAFRRRAPQLERPAELLDRARELAQVAPGLALGAGLAQQIGGMQHRQRAGSSRRRRRRIRARRRAPA